VPDDAVRIDAHMHLWQIARGGYGWLTPDLPIHRDYGLDDARSAVGDITDVILVQAAPTEAETRYLLDIAHRAEGFVRAVIGWADLAAPDAPAHIAALARDPMLRGLRPMLQDLADPDWILRPDVARGLDAMVRASLVLDLLIRPVHLPHCLTLAARHPELVMVIDHGAKPDIAGGGFDRWRSMMTEIAANTAIACKLSGLVTEIGPGDDWSAVEPYVGALIEAFGPDRLIWGSDWPVVTLATDYGSWFRLARTLVNAMHPESETAIFVKSAVHIYGNAGGPLPPARNWASRARLLS
jgi:L-fuconolactonase